MKNSIAAFLLCIGCGVGMAAIPTMANAEKTEENQRRIIKKRGDGGAILTRLRSGGLVILMRHANSPTEQENPVALGDNCDLADGRGLDTKGILQSSLIKDFLLSEGVSVSGVFTSHLCRTVDTARLVAPTLPAIHADGLASTDATKIAAFKSMVATTLEQDGGNILLVSHSNIVPLYGATAADGEDEVPSGTVFIIDPATWYQLARIDIETNVEVKMKVRAQ